MNSIGRFLDILVAFCAMFILPLVFFNYSENNRMRVVMMQKADAVLELTVNSGEIAEEVWNTLYRADGLKTYYYGEIEVERTEYFPENIRTEKGSTLYTDENCVTVRFSNDEILKLMDGQKKIPLRTGDRVTVKIYARGLFGYKARLLTERCRTV